MGFVVTKGTGDKPIKDSEVKSTLVENKKLIVGAKPRTEEEEKKIEEDKKKAELAWEEKRKAMKAKKSKIVKDGVSEEDAQKLAMVGDLEKENSDLKNKLTSVESEKSAEVQKKDKTIEELKAENEALKLEAEKKGGNNTGKNKPPKK